ncbi:MAG: hypothetical protein AB7F40_00710 [Victivallaceae bacterium]
MTDSDIADKYYTHTGEAAQLKAIQAVSGTQGLSPQSRIAKALEYLATPPETELKHNLIHILSH